MGILASAKGWAKRIKQDFVAVYFAAHDPRTPWPVRFLAFLVAAYALSPIDLIPDFIPVIGYLDDLLIVPLGLMWVLRLLRGRCSTTREQRRQSASNGRAASLVWSSSFASG